MVKEGLAEAGMIDGVGAGIIVAGEIEAGTVEIKMIKAG
jgi:hypothetical protein